MSDQAAVFTLMKQMAQALARVMHPMCEVVIHDFSDLDHSIVHIEGKLTGRSIGGAATNLLLERVRSGATDEDLYNYITTLPGGQVMKSSTIFLRDDQGQAYGAFCVNMDITAFASFRRLLGDFLTSELPHVQELLSDDPHRTIDMMITETLAEMDRALPILSRQDKIDLIARLDARGVFQVKKAVPILADRLSMSRATLYNYLGEARDDRQQQHPWPAEAEPPQAEPETTHEDSV
ncbi:MAG: PAS domain-containing protein [Anaerolineae bacterium]|jgi:predicted transcriptional regulator YheO|nr:PAS domain-containing protein [Anaerolineae bacterium]